MESQLHHVGINSDTFEDTVRFFETLFAMDISRTRGEAPHRTVWFRQGIQINEVPGPLPAGRRIDHLCIQVADWKATRQRAAALGCGEIEGKPHWFISPDGIVIELTQ